MAEDESHGPEGGGNSDNDQHPRAEVEASDERGSEASQGAPDGAEVPDVPEDAGETEEQYEPSPGGGHRVTRRTVHRTRVVEDVEETVTEYLPPSAYVAPTAPGHPAPVG